MGAVGPRTTRGRRVRRAHSALMLLAAGVMSTIALLLHQAPAHAHAVLLRADPSDGAVLALPPNAVRLVFNEPVDPIGPGLRVFAADGTRIDLGRVPTRADVDSDDRSVLAVALPSDMLDGGYVATWRVRSIDGHAIAGALRFTVGDALPVTDEVAAALTAASGATWVRNADRAVRGLMLLGLLVASGVAAASVAVVRTPTQRRSATRIILSAAVASLALVPVGLWLQGAVVSGTTALPAVGSAIAGGAQLPAATVRTVGLVLLITLARRGVLSGLLVLPAAALALLPIAGEGHQRSSGPSGDAFRMLLPGLDAVHVSAGALWVGAVLLLSVTLRSRGDVAVAEGDTAAALATRVGRTATAALIAVSLAGAGQAVLLLDTPLSLVTTAYGATLLGKIAVVTVAVTVAALARRRATRTGGWHSARRLLRVELGLLGAAVLVTGALITLPPPVDVEAVMFSSSAPLGEGLSLDVGVDSSRPGRTELHVFVVEDGALTDRELDVRTTLTSIPDGIGPFRVTPSLVEPGHWFAALEPLPSGEWSLEVTVGLDRFTERTTTFRVPLP